MELLERIEEQSHTKIQRSHDFKIKFFERIVKPRI
jgi:hypothetical protein